MSFLYLPPCLSTQITATTQIHTKAAELWGFHGENTDAENPTAVTIRNGSADTSTVLWTFNIPKGTVYDWRFPQLLYFCSALRFVVSGGSCYIDVLWRKF